MFVNKDNTNDNFFSNLFKSDPNGAETRRILIK